MKIYPELNSIAAEYEDVLKAGRKHDAAGLDEQFHNLITETSKNPYILQFSAVLLFQSFRQSKMAIWEMAAAFEKTIR
ncbi:FCD domain-containing protein [Bacillus swezeyi]|uniref:FCD domain-containing protein n=1 Tax=Bacillus swezeyi TaxID=1925020 RepID=UPI001EFBD368|nr:FCD domain-containing protein [Bacillus swezeyi]MEC1259652.1 FCD domain-containing protein [Bacillus swezeyi]MED2927385.1 FCD domain-containing protein [Bacillus swezeyi]MED2941637.1 FCD domain-containing protein [Bacillus swezeyi]MED2962583.1 FCD domain-containing protein [Bacillus swezeyi]MED2977185.1 FCD domain-containing protein [Bacillus swezeyi]